MKNLMNIPSSNGNGLNPKSFSASAQLKSLFSFNRKTCSTLILIENI